MPLKRKNTFCTIICGDSRKVLPRIKRKAELIVTSPPYGDARKSHYDSINPDHYADWFMTFHKALWNALADDGNLVLNLKDKIVDGTRHRFIWDTIWEYELAGWKAVDDYIWRKQNPAPGYWPNRLRDGWEYCFHLAKTTKPNMFQENVKVPIGNWSQPRMSKLRGTDLVRHQSSNNSGFGRDLRRWLGKTMVLPSNVIDLPLVGHNYGHPAVYPVGLPDFFIRLFTNENGLVIDPFAGSGSTGIAAINLHRNCILIDNNKKYCNIAYKRIEAESILNGTKVEKIGF
jgi:site-specific DNA-methyltransferase (adenine-specific)/site-specific DNA-methyltransferase (cytosine-N4-specific)